MKLAVIVTSNMIKEKVLPHDRGFHMALGQHLFEPEYFAYFRMLARHGCHIIVDNGAAEKDEPDVPFKDIVAMALRIDADEIILPDKLYEAGWTVEATLAAYEWVPEEKRMIVPQGRSISEWQACYRMLARNVDHRSVGIPKVCEDFEGGRPALVEWVHKMDCYVEIHFLGVHRRPIQEVYQAALAGVRSIDTAAPVAYAQHCMSITDEQPRISLDWNAQYVSYTYMDANMTYLEGVIEDASNIRRSQGSQGNRVH